MKPMAHYVKKKPTGNQAPALLCQAKTNRKRSQYASKKPPENQAPGLLCQKKKTEDDDAPGLLCKAYYARTHQQKIKP